MSFDGQYLECHLQLLSGFTIFKYYLTQFKAPFLHSTSRNLASASPSGRLYMHVLHSVCVTCFFRAMTVEEQTASTKLALQVLPLLFAFHHISSLEISCNSVPVQQVLPRKERGRRRAPLRRRQNACSCCAHDAVFGAIHINNRTQLH